MKRIVILVLTTLVSVALKAQVKIDSPRNHGMDPERLARVDEVIAEAIRDSRPTATSRSCPPKSR